MSYTNGVGNGLGNLQQLFGTGDVAATGKTATDTKASAAGTAASATVTADQASLSTVGGLVAAALNGSDVRTEKVAALQQAIGNGTYNVSAADVADKLIGALLQ